MYFFGTMSLYSEGQEVDSFKAMLIYSRKYINHSKTEQVPVSKASLTFGSLKGH